MLAQPVAMLAQSVAMLAQSVTMLAQSVAMLAQSMGEWPSVFHFSRGLRDRGHWERDRGGGRGIVECDTNRQQLDTTYGCLYRVSRVSSDAGI